MSTWTGAGDGSSWSDPNNWSPIGVPPSYLAVDIAQSGGLPVGVVVAAGQSQSGNPLTLGAAGTSEAVTLTNNGTFSNYAGVTLYAGTTFANAGALTLNGEDVFGTQTNTGTEQVNGNVTIENTGVLDSKAGGSLGVSGILTVIGSLHVEGALTSSTGLAGGGQVLVDGGTLTGGNGTPLSITGTSLSFMISLGGTLSVAPPTAADSFAFGPTAPGHASMLVLPSWSGTVASAISGFDIGDVISTGAAGAVSITANGGGYSVSIGSLTIANLNLAGGLTGADIRVNGGNISVACYCRGTRIATPGGEIPVEALRIGDIVRTHAGQDRPVKWIGRRAYAAGFAALHQNVLPIRICRNALADGVPGRDLLVSPEHALLVDGVLVPARHLVNGVSILPADGRADVQYFHIELDAHDIILAEGQPAETFVDCDSRAMFDNADEYVSLYPYDALQQWKFCARRIEDGEQLADIRYRINLRAGLVVGDWRRDQAPGPLTGNLEVVSGNLIAGWVQDVSAPERPVRLEILDNGHVIARVLANAYRRDLEEAGLGSGRHAFSHEPLLLTGAGAMHVITVRRASDQAAVPGSPGIISSEAVRAHAEARWKSWEASATQPFSNPDNSHRADSAAHRCSSASVPA